MVHPKGGVVSKVYEIAKPIAEELKLDIWDITYSKEGANMYLRIYIDTPNGVTIEDCEAMSRAIDKPLDKLDQLNVSYCLEVSSPGLERKLTKKEHFEKFLGSSVSVHLIRPDENSQRDIIGILEKYDNNGDVSVKCEDGEIRTYTKKDISYVKLDDFRG